MSTTFAKALSGFALVLLVLCAAPARALEADELALVVNKRVPEGRKLAEFYAAQRHVPDGRIIELDLDPLSPVNPAEEMAFSDYEAKVAAPVRSFLQKNDPQHKITCLVTFWGVPLRIGNHVLSPSEKQELETLHKDLDKTRAALNEQVAALEQSATQLDSTFTPQTGSELPQLGPRLDAAVNAIIAKMPHIEDPAARSARFIQLISAAERLIGSARTRELMSRPPLSTIAPRPPSAEALAKAKAELEEIQHQLQLVSGYSTSAEDRRMARDLAQKHLGLLGYAGFLSTQADLLKTEETESALDSELALLWWKGYPRTRWVDNPLAWRYQFALRQRRLTPPPIIMVMRLDGPSVKVVRELISNSIKVEAAGLKGQVALDARGKPAGDAYGNYDQTIRNLAEFLKARTKLDVTLDNKESLIPAHTLHDIALYCGWYSLRNYIPPGSFSPGAVGFHVASLELISLRGPDEHGWVRGLLSDGVVGTLGPVAEPYLHSFPPADEFFPLLLTGKLTLAEVYWRTCPLASWMQTCIGDPLYTPYKVNPPLKPQDLPQQIQVAFQRPVNSTPATEPTTQPTTAPVGAGQ